MAGFSPDNIGYQLQHIHDDRSADLVGTVITMAILVTIAMTLRFISRKQMRVAISYDDYSMLFALVSVSPSKYLFCSSRHS